MKFIVGLGNPGAKYETTRHNIGFLLVDYLLDAWKASGPQVKNNALVWTVDSQEILKHTQGEKILLIKPQTFMNLSGRSVAPLVDFYKGKPEDIIVIHDDLDISLFALRIKKGGGSGGHNGIKSIDACLGNEKQNYYRIRVGIGRPSTSLENKNTHEKMDIADWVLQSFSQSELNLAEASFKDIENACFYLFKNQLGQAQNQFHKKGDKNGL